MVSRAELIALLEERARRLRPSDESLSRALRRCVRHDLRSQRRGSGRHVAIDAEPTDPQAQTADEDVGLPLTMAGMADAGETNAPIATAVAQANTVTDQSVNGTSVDPIDSDADIPRSTTRRHTRRLESGRILGGYRIEGLLGLGGMGQVYRATQLSMNRQVALKVLSPRYTENTRFRERFLREARAAGRLAHPNLIAVHDVGETEGSLYFSMELVEGQTTRDRLEELPDNRFPDDTIFAIAAQALDALRYAHSHGVIHRDVKPDNLMITATDTVKLADLGLARCDQDAEEDFTTKTGTMMGTPFYMPPEQGRDAHRADQRADLYSLGASLFHLACGRVPFEGETAVAILINATTQPLEFPEPGPGQPVQRLISALMEKKPTDRPASAGEALDLLRQLQHGHSLPPPRRPAVEMAAAPAAGIAPSKPQAKPRSRRRARWRWLLLFALAVIVAGAVATILLDPTFQARRSARDFAADHRYAAALAELQRASERNPSNTKRIDQLAASIQTDWNAWAKTQAGPGLAEVQAAIASRDFPAAEKGLSRLAREEAWRSPAVLADLEALESSLSDAVLRQSSGDERRRVVQELAQRWLTDTFTGKAKLTADSVGSVELRGNGSANLGSVQWRGRPVPLGILVEVTCSGPQMVTLEVDGKQLRLSAGGIQVEKKPGEWTLLSSGPTRFTIARRGEGLLVDIGGESLRAPTGTVTMHWEAADSALLLSAHAQPQRSTRLNDP